MVIKMKLAKRILSMVIAMVMCFAVAVPMAGAQTYSEDGESAYSLQTSMTCELEMTLVSGTDHYKALATSKARGTSAVTQIKAEQWIQKHWALGLFFTANENSHFTQYSYTNSITASSLATSFGAGTYRVKTVFTFETANGTQEQYTVYSDEVTVS